SRTSPRSTTSLMRSASSGVSDANSSASTTSVGVGTSWLPVRYRGLCARYRGLAFDHDLSEELGLLCLDAPQADELEHGEQGHDDLGAPAIARGQGREEQGPGVAQDREDHRHPLDHRRRVRLDLPWTLPRLLLDQPSQGTLDEVHAQILERHFLGRRQGAARTAPDERL